MAYRALVVDDELGLRDVVADLLDMEGFEVTTCGGVESAKGHLGSQDFDIALVDVFLTDQPVGLQLVNHIIEEYPQTGVVIMTGFADRSQVEKAVISGAYTCIDKPFDLDDLLRVVNMVLDGKSGGDS